MTASDLYKSGDLSGAVQAALAEVKAKPMDTASRLFLAELLCFNGELERADRQLDTLVQQALEAAVRMILLRHLVRAEIARHQFYAEARLPEFVLEATPSLRCRLDALIATREGKQAEAKALLNQAEKLRPKLTGTCNGVAFDDFRDLDDLSAGYLDVLTSTGKYYVVPFECIEYLEFSPPARPIDLLWRETQINVTNGPDGQVYIPSIYPHTTDDGDDQLRLGRGTDWREADDVPVRGRGLRTFLVGDEDKTIMQIQQLRFDRT